MPIISGGGGGGSAFNGGTITAPLVVATGAATDVPLTLTPPAGAAALFTEVLHVGDGQGHTLIGADAGGDVYVTVSAGGPNFSVTADASIVLNATDSGIFVAAPAAGEVQVQDHAGNPLIRAEDANALAFFGTAPIAKPTGVPVDAAGIHAALVSLGLIAA